MVTGTDELRLRDRDAGGERRERAERRIVVGGVARSIDARRHRHRGDVDLSGDRVGEHGVGDGKEPGALDRERVPERLAGREPRRTGLAGSTDAGGRFERVGERAVDRGFGGDAADGDRVDERCEVGHAVAVVERRLRELDGHAADSVTRAVGGDRRKCPLDGARAGRGLCATVRRAHEHRTRGQGVAQRCAGGEIEPTGRRRAELHVVGHRETQRCHAAAHRLTHLEFERCGRRHRSRVGVDGGRGRVDDRRETRSVRCDRSVRRGAGREPDLQDQLERGARGETDVATAEVVREGPRRRPTRFVIGSDSTDDRDGEHVSGDTGELRGHDVGDDGVDAIAGCARAADQDAVLERLAGLNDVDAARLRDPEVGGLNRRRGHSHEGRQDEHGEDRGDSTDLLPCWEIHALLQCAFKTALAASRNEMVDW